MKKIPLPGPLTALFIFELPLFLGLPPTTGWSVPGALMLAFVLLREWRSGPSAEWSRLLTSAVLVPLLLLIVTAWFALIPLRYYSLGYTVFDTGIFAGALHTFFETGRYYSALLETHALRDHFTPNLLLLSPLLFQGSSFLVLPLVKLVAFLLSALLLCKLSRLILGATSRFQLAVPALWMVHSFVARAVDSEFQPSSLALPFIFLAFLFAIQGRRRALVATLIFVIGFKEHLSLLSVCIGIFLLLRDPRDRLSYPLIVLGVLVGPILFTTIMPLFDPHTITPHAQRFGPLEELPRKISLIFLALCSVGFLPLFAPRSLLWIIPSFGIALASRDPQMLSFNFHYQDLPLAVVFVGALYGLRQWERDAIPGGPLSTTARARIGVIVIASLIATNLWYPFRSIRKQLPSAHSVAVVSELRALAPRLPASCTVWTLNSLGVFFFRSAQLKVLLRADQQFASEGTIIITAPDVSSWPLSPAEHRTVIDRIERTEAFKKRPLYQQLDVYSTDDCLL